MEADVVVIISCNNCESTYSVYPPVAEPVVCAQCDSPAVVRKGEGSVPRR